MPKVKNAAVLLKMPDLLAIRHQDINTIKVETNFSIRRNFQPIKIQKTKMPKRVIRGLQKLPRIKVNRLRVIINLWKDSNIPNTKTELLISKSATPKFNVSLRNMQNLKNGYLALTNINMTCLHMQNSVKALLRQEFTDTEIMK